MSFAFFAFFNILMDLLKRGTLLNVVEDLLATALDTGNNEMAPRLFHGLHGFKIKIHAGIAQPAKAPVQPFLDHQFAYFYNTFLPDGERIIFKYDLAHVWKVLCDIFKFLNHILCAAHAISMAVHRLRIYTKSAARHTASSRKHLNLRIFTRCEKNSPYS